MKSLLGTLIIPCALGLLSCEHQIAQETRVSEDGTLNKTIVLDMEQKDSAALLQNYFGVGEEKGWNVGVEESLAEEDQNRYRVRFEKEFTSAEAMNAELDTDVDSLFQVHASFEKQFRWFYTYIRYEETFEALNRFRTPSPTEVFSQEDFQFIDRLPPDGAKLSEEDSIYLERFDNEKVGEQFANRALYNENMEILRKLITMSGLESRWLDTVARHEPLIYKSLDRIDELSGDDRLPLWLSDSLQIPLPETARPAFDSLWALAEARVNFMSYAWDGHYSIAFEMPWTVVNTNADSIIGNRLFWRPRPHKFAFNDYTFYAEARKPSILGIALTAILVVATGFIIYRRRQKANSQPPKASP